MKRGFIAGAWDLLHPGHIHVLGISRSKCDYLIIGLHIDPRVERPSKSRPIQTVFERFVQLEACRYVDKIIPYETEEDLLNILNTIKIDIRFLGTEYKEKDSEITGKDYVHIEYIPRFHNFSTTELKERL